MLDFSESSIKELTKKGIEPIRRFMAETPEQHHCKSVIVVGTKFEFGLARMLGLTLDYDAPVDRFVCRSVREALEWLRPGRADELIEAHEEACGAS